MDPSGMMNRLRDRRERLFSNLNNIESIDPICDFKAYPEGIPAEILDVNSHATPLSGQDNDLVYEPIKDL
jgi:hypothetical protein